MLIEKPLRHRSEAHRRFVATQPCCVCHKGLPSWRTARLITGEALSQCAHLAWMQPRARGMKAGDQWTIPLCVRHHSAMDQAGDGATWLKNQGVDGADVADDLWCDSLEAGRVRLERRAA
jgi:hypothetical protein